MKQFLVFITLLACVVLLLPTIRAGSTYSSRLDSANHYWFQVGVFMTGYETVTGGSVEIRTRMPQANTQAQSSYWVGLNLPNNAFIQVGYLWPTTHSHPQQFWEYYLPGTASQGGGRFQGGVGSEVGSNGTWSTYSIQSKGNFWFAYIDGVLIGSVNLGTSNSGGNTPYAIAEISDTLTTRTILGPVEFRNLSYRDMNNVWHPTSEAIAYAGYGAGSGTLLPTGERFSYGLQIIGVNDWLAGSGFQQTYNNTIVWF